MQTAVAKVPADAAVEKAWGVAKDVGNFALCQAVPCSVKLAAYPMERIRLLMQTQHTNTTFGKVSFKSLAATVSHMKGEAQYFTAAWRGATPTLVRWGPSQYMHLFLKEHLSTKFPAYNKKDQYGMWMASKVASGAATGILVAAVWAYPFDVIRQQLATKNSGSWQNAGMEVYQRFGMRGFYRGFMMDAPGLAIFRGVQLGGWDVVKDHYGARWAEMSIASHFVHAQMISLSGSVCAYPWDTVRRNLIGMDKVVSYGEVLRSGVATAGGVRQFFYAGFTARIISSFVNGALLEGFDAWKRTRGDA
eukprot:TRINITY_DN325_c0_g1_i3.p1 TRINITY_DN325_c0_g1~~TRINITY_DN325_c0_g1_i3.p1  ORF type:complete len:305 (+),score=129.26 TRINITY_DN325_c0_g1_i3:72-986(+)